MHLNHLEAARSRRRARGFSLMEVMVALVVSTVGLLGLAKMEALAVSSTSVAGSRSLAAIQASSLAAAMHANPGFWQAGFAPASIVISNALNPYSAAAPCTASPGVCIPSAMAAYDLQQWSNAVNAVLPGYVATINCSQVIGIPVTCTIQLQWTENGVAANAKQTQMASLAAPTYTLFVQP